MLSDALHGASLEESRKTVTAKEKRLQFVTLLRSEDTNIPYYCLTSIAISVGLL